MYVNKGLNCSCKVCSFHGLYLGLEGDDFEEDSIDRTADLENEVSR